MKTFIGLLIAEVLKLRRTLALWMVLIAPAFVILLQVMLWMNYHDGISIDADLWIMFFTNILSMWAIFMFPLFSALVVALLYHYEHTTSGWQKLFSLPVPKWQVLAAKQAAGFVLLCASGVVLFAGTVAGGMVVDVLHQKIEMPADIPVAAMAERWGKIFLASATIVALQHWVSLRWTTLAVPIGAGITGTFVAVFASSWKYGHFYPWLIPIHVLHRTDGKEVTALMVGAILGIVLFIMMIVTESRRDLSR